MNEKLLDIGKLLMTEKCCNEKNNPDLSVQIKSVIQEAAEKNIPLPFVQLSEALGLVDYEELLVCLLWYCQRTCGAGLAYERLAALLRPYEKENGQKILAPCFHYDKQEVFLSPVAWHFLEGRLPEDSEYNRFVIPEKEQMYDRNKLLEPGKRLIKGIDEHKTGSPIVLVLSGKTGSGREYLAEQLAAEHGVSLLIFTVTKQE